MSSAEPTPALTKEGKEKEEKEKEERHKQAVQL
jgi:hypothetical protein